MFIDTHCHLFSEEFDTDRKECIERALSNNIKKILLPNIDSTTIQALYYTEKQYPDICHAMMGLHPTSVKENFTEELKVIEKELHSRKFAGIGEIGMDLYWDKRFVQEQRIAFKTQLEWAVHFNYPVSIHCRDAFDEIFDVLDSMNEIPKGVFHCFTGTGMQAEKILGYKKFKIGIGGVITFKKSALPEILSQIDMSSFVLETDAPYLAPAPFRGKRNEPSYLRYIAEKLSEIKNIPLAEIEEICWHNTKEIFNIS